MKVGVFTNYIDGSVAHHRLKPWLDLPGSYLIEKFPEQGTTHVVTNNSFYPKDYDYIKFKRQLNAVGIKLIFDVDDFWQTDRWNPAHSHFQKTLLMKLSTYALVDIFTTTHVKLADEIHKVNPHADIHIIPNGLNTTDPQWKPSGVKDRSFGFIGGKTHRIDVQQMAGIQEKVDVFGPDYLKEELGAKKTFSYKPLHEYGYLYDEFSISLAPLSNTKFCTLKSDLKAVEAGFKNKLLIASDIHPYNVHKDAVLCKRSRDWHKAIKIDLQEAKEKAQALHEYMIKFRNLDRLNEYRRQIVQ